MVHLIWRPQILRCVSAYRARATSTAPSAGPLGEAVRVSERLRVSARGREGTVSAFRSRRAKDLREEQAARNHGELCSGDKERKCSSRGKRLPSAATTADEN